MEKLTLQYNKARQARITMELVEIISGASALWRTSDYFGSQNEIPIFVFGTNNLYLKAIKYNYYLYINLSHIIIKFYHEYYVSTSLLEF